MHNRTDEVGTIHGRAAPGFRIVSLVPSLTELLCDLDLAEHLVGRTGFCIHPRETLKSVAKVGGTKDVDIEKIRQLQPTHLVVNIDENRREVVESLAAFVDHVIVTHPITPQDNLKLFDLLGFIFDRDEQAADLSVRFNRALLCARESATVSTNVLYLIWRDPWMTITSDTYISRTLALINWHSSPAKADARYPEIDISTFVGTVDKVLLSSEPYPFREKHLTELRAEFGTETDVRLIDGELISWYGSRAIAGLEYLARLAEQQRRGEAHVSH